MDQDDKTKILQPYFIKIIHHEKFFYPKINEIKRSSKNIFSQSK